MRPVVTAKELKRLPPEVAQAVVQTNSSFTPPPGWRETPGAMHRGRNQWLIPVERDTAAIAAGEDEA